jgi:predicted XRE-type DNA-binding protein
MNNLFGNLNAGRKGVLHTIHAYWGTFPLVVLLLAILSFFLSTITCLIKPGTTYERFDTQIPNRQISLAEIAKKWTVQLEKDDALLDKVSDATCAVFKQISQTTIQSDSAPTLDTPTPVDNDALKRRAIKKFQDAKKTYMATHNNQPLLECFAGDDDKDAESDLQAAYAALNAQLNETNMKLKARSVNATLGFTRPYVNDIMNGFTPQQEGFALQAEGFALQGLDLITKTQALIEEAKRIHNLIQALPDVALHQKQVLDSVNAQKAKVSKPDEYAQQAKDPKYSE